MKTESRPQLCATCGQQFDSPLSTIDGIGSYFQQIHCIPCQEMRKAALNAESDAASRAAQAKFWEDRCPLEFRTLEEGGHTDVNRLQLEQGRVAEAMNWQFGRRGLLLIGPSGRCKTRVAWRIVRREWEAGRGFIALKAHRFGVESVERQTNRGFKKWFDTLVKVPLLFIDDLGKGKFTEAVESHFFGLIDERTESGRPVIITTNSTGAGLSKRMSEDRGEPLIRRLRDYCDTIVFT